MSEGVVDPAIFSLANLNFLRLANSTLTQVPEEVGCLVNLTQLELQCNKIEELPASIGKLKKLKLLDVSENKLEEIPDEISCLKNLTTFCARGNAIEILPSFEACENLSVIDVRRNKLESIEEILHDKLGSVTEILASDNEIEEIEEGLRFFKNLRVLNLSQNKIKEIPEEVINCTKMKGEFFKAIKNRQPRTIECSDCPTGTGSQIDRMF